MKRQKNYGKLNIYWLVLIFGLIILFLISVCLGRYPISVKNVLAFVFKGADSGSTEAALLLNYRLPRIFMACLTGGALSVAGASFQSVFKNPLAAPDLLGASNGAAFGAALAIILGLGRTIAVPFAFVVSFASVFFVMSMGSRIKGKRVVGLILAGIMISSFFSAATSYLKLVADPLEELPAITYWLMGSLNKTKKEDVYLMLIPVCLGCIPLFINSWRLNVLTLGDDEARTLGVNPGRLRTVSIICASLLTAGSVAFSGVIGWIGLVIPHLSRRIVGNDLRKLFPFSFVFGAAFLLLVDDISRTVSEVEIPIGILMAFIGAPFFIYLMVGKGDKV